MSARLVAVALAVASCSAQALITAGDPGDNVLAAGAYSGVGTLLREGPSGLRPGCNGTLLTSGRHVLTAAHCVVPGLAQVRFDTAAGPVQAAVAAAHVHPNAEGTDLAILELAEVMPDSVQRHDIYRGDDEVGQVFTKVGQGSVGTGATGQFGFDSHKRIGGNRFDTTFDHVLASPWINGIGAAHGSFAEGPLAFVPQQYLVFDFDDGSAGRDVAGLHLGLVDRGLGALEINTGQRDSGSPAFIGDRIAGITSFGFSDFRAFDTGTWADATITEVLSLEQAQALLPAPVFASFLAFFQSAGITDLPAAFGNLLSSDGSFGEFSAEARVSVVADWIDQVTAVPEPGSAWLLLAGAAWLCLRRGRAPRAG